MHPHLLSSRREFLRSAGVATLAGLTTPVFAEDVPKVPTTQEALRKAVEDAPLAMKFTGKTAEDAKKWQASFGEKLRQLLGPHTPPKTWKTSTRETKDFDDYSREDLVLTADKHPPLPVYLLRPRGKAKAEKKLPGVVAIHGHGGYGHHPVAGRDDLPGVAKAIENANYDYGRQLARKGYVVACPCLTPFGERQGKKAGDTDACADTFIRMQILGKLLIAENLRDCLWALELLAADSAVDAEKLGCVGLSYGGRMTTLTAAVEPRIKVAVISGALNVMQERVSQPYGCGAQIIPGLLQFGDIPEIGSLIAPRYCLWETGTKDALMKPAEAEDALVRMRKVFAALDAEDHLQRDSFDGGHRWHGEVAYPLLEKVLK
jgi:dienelactone hydrolase